jgi:hypothetical protein
MCYLRGFIEMCVVRGLTKKLLGTSVLKAYSSVQFVSECFPFSNIQNSLAPEVGCSLLIKYINEMDFSDTFRYVL